MDLRQKQENEAIAKAELDAKKAAEKAREDAQKKIYLLGKFEPAERDDFVSVPEKYNISGRKIYARKETLEAFEKMAESAEKNSIELNITSATRNFDYQKELWEKKWTGTTFVEGKKLPESVPNGQERFEKILEYSAVHGTSRHHWGTDIDINGVDPKYFETREGEKVYEWLKENAPLFGFCQTYDEKGITRFSGYNEEKWHWSYLPLARGFTQEYKNLIRDEDIAGFLGDEYIAQENLINNYVLSINPECI